VVAPRWEPGTGEIPTPEVGCADHNILGQPLVAKLLRRQAWRPGRKVSGPPRGSRSAGWVVPGPSRGFGAPPIKDGRQPFYSAGETGCGFLEVRPTSGDKHRAPRFRARFAILARASAVADATAIERTVTVNAVTVDATSRVCCEFGRYLYETASCAGPTSTCLGNAEVSTSAATAICGSGGSFAR